MEESTGQRIKNLLYELKISEAELARRIGMTRTAINQMLKGESKVSANMIMGIAQEFPDVDIRWLLTGKKAEDLSLVSEPEVGYARYNPMQEKDQQIKQLHEMIKQLISKIPDAETSQSSEPG